jgi:hypothetical protein
MFFDPDIGSGMVLSGRNSVLLQSVGGARDEVVRLRQLIHPGQGDGTVIPWCEGKRVAVVQELEERLEFVVAVVAASGDVQEEVEFGRGRQ